MLWEQSRRLSLFTYLNSAVFVSQASLPRRAYQLLRRVGIVGSARRIAHAVGWRSRKLYWRMVNSVPFLASTLRRLRSARTSSARRSAGRKIGAVTRGRVDQIVAQIEIASASSTPEETREAPTLPVAVVVPAYQAADYLDDCLASVARQTYTDWRCYVVDDGSTDETSAIASAWERKDPRFRLIRHGANRGLSAARNTGLREAVEPTITFLDADDLLVSRSLDRRVNAMRFEWFREDVVGTWSATPQVPEETTIKQAESLDRAKPNDGVDFVQSEGECPFNAHASLMRTEVLRRAGGFDERLVRGSEDWDLWQRLLRHGYRFAGAAGIAGVYRQRQASMVRRDLSGHLAASGRLIDQAETHVVIDRSFAVDAAASLPLSVLEVGSRRLKRAAIYGGIGVGSSADASAIDDPSILEFLTPVTEAEFHRLGLPETASAGLNRGLGLGVASGSLAPGTATRIAQIGSQIARRLHEQVAVLPIEEPNAEPAVDLRPVYATVDYLLIAETAADVAPMLQAVQAVAAEDDTVAYLDLEVVKGDEGATAAFDAAGIDGHPFNHFAFGRIEAGAVVVRRPFGPVTAEVLATCGDSIAIVEVPAAERELELPCNASSAVETSSLATGFSPSPPTARSMVTNYGRLLLKEEGPIHPPSVRLLDELRDKHRGEAVVIVGNGPSLNDTPLEQLGGVPTIAVNGIFYAAERFPDPITYYVVEDTSVFRENTQEIKDFATQYKLFPTSYLDAFSPQELDESIGFFRMNAGFYGRDTGTLCHPRFSVDPRQRLYCGQSVTIINLQLAYWMGFSRVVLIGMDFSYTIPDDVDREGDLITSNSDDVNHFHPDYFGKGKSWKDPKLDRVLVNYRLAKEMFEADGREIVNATVGGRLEIFRRMDLLEAVKVPVT